MATSSGRGGSPRQPLGEQVDVPGGGISSPEFELSLFEIRQLLHTLESSSTNRSSREYIVWARGLDRDFSTKWDSLLTKTRYPDMLEACLRILYHFIRYMKGSRAKKTPNLVPVLREIALDNKIRGCQLGAKQGDHDRSRARPDGSRPKFFLKDEAGRKIVHPRLSAVRILWELHKQKLRAGGGIDTEEQDEDEDAEGGFARAGAELKNNDIDKANTKTKMAGRASGIFDREMCWPLIDLLAYITTPELEDILGPLILDVFARGPLDCQVALVSLCLSHERGKHWGEMLLQFLNKKGYMCTAARMLLNVLKEDKKRDFLFTNDAAVCVDVLIREKREEVVFELLKIFHDRALVPSKKQQISDAIQATEAEKARREKEIDIEKQKAAALSSERRTAETGGAGDAEDIWTVSSSSVVAGGTSRGPGLLGGGTKAPSVGTGTASSSSTGGGESNSTKSHQGPAPAPQGRTTSSFQGTGPLQGGGASSSSASSSLKARTSSNVDGENVAQSSSKTSTASWKLKQVDIRSAKRGGVAEPDEPKHPLAPKPKRVKTGTDENGRFWEDDEHFRYDLFGRVIGRSAEWLQKEENQKYVVAAATGGGNEARQK